MRYPVILSCEHAHNKVPTAYKSVFGSGEEDLTSHLGWDPGALKITNELASTLGVKPFVYPFTRLLIEPNRSEDHPQLFSKYTETLSLEEKKSLLKSYYHPYRKKVSDAVQKQIDLTNFAIHISVHTFTPVYHGKFRTVDIGILFDPHRHHETDFARILREAISDDSLLVKYNEPYLGVDDGFTTTLRTKFDDDQYVGIELEINQKFENSKFNRVSEVLSNSVLKAIKIYENSRTGN